MTRSTISRNLTPTKTGGSSRLNLSMASSTTASAQIRAEKLYAAPVRSLAYVQHARFVCSQPVSADLQRIAFSVSFLMLANDSGRVWELGGGAGEGFMSTAYLVFSSLCV